jgi:hypothetical protein
MIMANFQSINLQGVTLSFQVAQETDCSVELSKVNEIIIDNVVFVNTLDPLYKRWELETILLPENSRKIHLINLNSQHGDYQPANYSCIS